MSEYLREIDEAFLSDPEIDEMGILLSQPPPAVVVTEHKLGLSMGILKPLFRYAIHRFQEILVLRNAGAITDDSIYLEGLSLSRAILLVKGDISIAINYRKEMMLRKLHDIDVELKFLRMLFTKHPKSPGAWQHRRWCIMQRSLDTMTAKDIEVEQDLCSRMSELYPKNYYAWNHRLWTIQFMNHSEVS
jgi:protein prenyltransferase alpha subunit repeat containing protein 1